MRKSSAEFAAGDDATQASGPTSADDYGATPLKRGPPEPTDDQIADIFAERHRDDLRYVAAWGRWYEWTGKLWREDGTLRALDLIRNPNREPPRRAALAQIEGNAKPMMNALFIFAILVFTLLLLLSKSGYPTW
jgi:hypothetical protein